MEYDTLHALPNYRRAGNSLASRHVVEAESVLLRSVGATRRHVHLDRVIQAQPYNTKVADQQIRCLISAHGYALSKCYTATRYAKEMQHFEVVIVSGLDWIRRPSAIQHEKGRVPQPNCCPVHQGRSQQQAVSSEKP